MKPRKSTLLVVLVALVLSVFAIAMAQGTTQTDQKKKDSCCVEGAKCCAEGAESCKEGDAAESCCKDGAESCEMHHSKDEAKGDAKAKHKHGEGDCCKMKQKDKAKAKKTA